MREFIFELNRMSKSKEFWCFQRKLTTIYFGSVWMKFIIVNSMSEIENWTYGVKSSFNNPNERCSINDEQNANVAWRKHDFNWIQTTTTTKKLLLLISHVNQLFELIHMMFRLNSRLSLDQVSSTMYLQDVSIPNLNTNQNHVCSQTKNLVFFFILHEIYLKTTDIIWTIELNNTSFNCNIARKWRSNLFRNEKTLQTSRLMNFFFNKFNIIFYSI